MAFCSQSDLSFRQVHLDFHTSPAIAGVGGRFSKAQFQEMLKIGHVDSITLFAKCHHGYSYYPTKIGTAHPHLDFDLLGAQIEACQEIGVKTPVYITAGWSELDAHLHPEWVVVPPGGLDTTRVGWKRLSLSGTYLDYLCEIIDEVLSLYPVDGLFLDIVGIVPDVSLAAQREMHARGLDPSDAADVLSHARKVQNAYFEATTRAARKHGKSLRIFHNAGHIPKGDKTFLQYASHLEIESLPTGGWGYDHFPLSARHAATLNGVAYLGMTGKFHTTWGDFGGFKHPNALRYECAAMLAYGARCSIGDQLHPNGEMNPDTYRRIGLAYDEVRAKEPWCLGARPVSEIALLSIESLKTARVLDEHVSERSIKGDVGASRVLLERGVMFDVIDTDADFSAYRLIVLPDEGRLSPGLARKLQGFLAQGGKLLLSGVSGLHANRDEFCFPVGDYRGMSEFDMEYLRARPALRKGASGDRLIESPFVIKGGATLVRPEKGSRILADRVEPYFNRTLAHFCSHQHAPDARKSRFPGAFVTATGNVAYFGPKVFSEYADRAPALVRDLVFAVLEELLGEPVSTVTSLPSAGRISLMDQPDWNRYVFHLLYATPIKRGDDVLPGRGIDSIEVIEDIVPLYDVEVALRLPQRVGSVRLVPSGESLEFKQSGSRIQFTVPRLECHQMIELQR